MVRALRNVRRDAGPPSRPEYRISTTHRALPQTSTAGNGKAAIDPDLQRLFDEFDAAEEAMRMLDTVEARRTAARAHAAYHR
jgi:hypothetical protein